ncbi:DUF4238 domain-containing protein [Aequorivita sediminis]|uniref:DUF4238 domain-containing protein n=1 Tax=Aequorivita sediminis TaxID=3073653 RepID=UPI0028AB1A0E|nr:DUF4238 domain-containing protein [Aequorivita sp. F6058]
MKNLSRKHHYLPVFYLKGFAKESNKFKIYNVQDKRFIKKGKEFSPKSYFYEKDGNTINFTGSKNDFLETEHYSHFDNNIAKLFEKINSSSNGNRFNIDENDMPAINHFVSLMYWRLPHRMEELKSIIKNNNLNTLGFAIKDSNGIKDKKVEEEFKNSEPFLKSYKYCNSLIDSMRGFDCRTPYTILETTDKSPFLCSDNPVIFEMDILPKVYEDDYLFPLSGNRLFIKTNKTKNFPAYLRFMVDTLVYKQAMKYVSCTDERYIDKLENNFEKSNISVNDLRADIFNVLK